MSKGQTHLLYSCHDKTNVPVGLVLGDIFISPASVCFNPIASSVQLRALREEDKNHPHLVDLETNREDGKPKMYFTLKVNGRSDIGTLMGFSGKACYHFTMKTWLIIFVSPRIFANGNELALSEGSHNLFVQGDVRVVVDSLVAHVYLLRGHLYDNGALKAQNKEHAYPLSTVGKVIECSWSSFPEKDQAPVLGKSSTGSTPLGSTRPTPSPSQADLVYLGMAKRKDKVEAIVFVHGLISRAPFEPFRFGKSKFELELTYESKLDAAVRSKLESNHMLVTIHPQGEALTCVYSASGHGFSVSKGATLKIIGQLIIASNKDGSLVSSFPVSPHLVEHLSGNLKIYLCDDSIVLLDNKSNSFQIDGKVY